MPSASAMSCRLVPAKPRSANSRIACSYISFSTSSRRAVVAPAGFPPVRPDGCAGAPAFLREPGDARVAQQQQFDLCGIDLLAAPVDDVFDPALDADVPLAADLTDRGQVPGAVEAVRSERPGVVRGRVEVSAHRVRAAAAQLADLAVGKFGDRARLEDPDLVHRGQRGADRGRAGFAGGAGTGGEEQ